MRILYIFPHPDDESFGPARGIAAQVRGGHSVSLLTLTRGGATRQRHRLGLSIEDMGWVRLREMQDVKEVLNLENLTVLDFPDGGLKELDPRELETAVTSHIQSLSPDIVVTYPVHGISGFHDHLITHAIVKRAVAELLNDGRSSVKRLAFFTLTQDQATAGSGVHSLSGSTDEEIDCLLEAAPADMAIFREALDCYVSYRETIDATGIKSSMNTAVAYEFFQESFSPPVTEIGAGLAESPRENPGSQS